MLATPLLHKPIIYGSDIANWGFWGLIILHLIPALVALISGILALAFPKGREKHIQWGMIFIWAMIATAASGILLDVIRLSFFVEENHQKYTDFGMPSTYPARIAFLYAAVCIIYLAKFASHPLNLSRETRPEIENKQRWLPATLVFIGLALSGLIFQYYNPWTGALWMIWTFITIVFITGFLPVLNSGYAYFGLHQHRFVILFLAAFSWWGALQGFGPALVIAVMGVDNNAVTYTGNLPGEFKASFFLFLLAWLPPFIVAAYLMRFFRRRAEKLHRD
jgi:MFS family permease